MIVDPKVIIKLFNEYLEGDNKKVKGDYSSFEAFIASRKGKKEPYFDGYAKADSIDLTKLAKTVDGDYNADDIVNKKYAELLVYLAKEPPLTVRNTKASLTEYIRPLLSALITKEAYLNIKPVDKAVIATESKKTENAYVTFISTEDIEKLNELLTTTGNGMLRTNEKIRKTKPLAKFWTVFRKYLLPPVLVGGAAATAGWLTTMFVQAGTNILWTGSVAGTALSFGALGVAGTLGVIGAVKAAKAFTRLYYERKYGRTAKKNDALLNELNEFDEEHITSYDDLVKTAGALPIVKLMELIRKKDELILKRRGLASWLNPLTRTMNRNRLHELMRYKQKLADIDAADPSYSKLKLLEKHLDTFLLANMENYFKQTRRTKNKAKFQNADIEAKHVMHSKKLVDVRSYINKRLAEIASLHVFGANADPTLIIEAADMRKVQKTEGKTSKKTKKAAKPEVKKDKPVKHKVNGKTLYVKDGKIYTDEECKTITTAYTLKHGAPVKTETDKPKTELDKVLEEIDKLISIKDEKEIKKMTYSEQVEYFDKLIALKNKQLQAAIKAGGFESEMLFKAYQESINAEIADLEAKRKEAVAKLTEEESIVVKTVKLGLIKKLEFKYNKVTGLVDSVITAGYTSASHNGEVGWISKDSKYFIDNKGNVTVVSDELQNGLRTITVAGAKREIKYKYKTDDGSVVSITTSGFTVKTYEGKEGWVSADGRVFINKDAKTKVIPLKKVSADDGATLYLNETTKELFTDVDGAKPVKKDTYFIDAADNVLAVWEVKVVKDEAEKVAYNRQTKKFYKEDKKTILTDIEIVGGEFVRKTISALIEKTYGSDKVWVDPTSKKVYKNNAGKAGDELADLTYNGTEVIEKVKTRKKSPKEIVEEQETTVKAIDGTEVKVKAKVKVVEGKDPQIVEILEVLTAGYKLNDKGEVIKATTTKKKKTAKIEEQETTVKATDGTEVKVKAKVKVVEGKDPQIVEILEVLTADYKLNDKGEVEKIVVTETVETKTAEVNKTTIQFKAKYKDGKIIEVLAVETEGFTETIVKGSKCWTNGTIYIYAQPKADGTLHTQINPAKKGKDETDKIETITIGSGVTATTIEVKVDEKGNILEILTPGYTKGIHEGRDGWLNKKGTMFVRVDKSFVRITIKKASKERN